MILVQRMFKSDTNSPSIMAQNNFENDDKITKGNHIKVQMKSTKIQTKAQSTYDKYDTHHRTQVWKAKYLILNNPY